MDNSDRKVGQGLGRIKGFNLFVVPSCDLSRKNFCQRAWCKINIRNLATGIIIKDTNGTQEQWDLHDGAAFVFGCIVIIFWDWDITSTKIVQSHTIASACVLAYIAGEFFVTSAGPDCTVPEMDRNARFVGHYVHHITNQILRVGGASTLQTTDLHRWGGSSLAKEER